MKTYNQIGTATGRLSSSKSNLRVSETRRNHADKSTGTIEVVDTPFSVVKRVVAKQFETMKASGALYRVDLSGMPQVLNEETGMVETRGPLSFDQRRAETGDVLWDAYLAAFPEGANPVYRERTDHDCQCCKNFVRTLGGVVAVVDGELATIWGGERTGTYYDVVRERMDGLARSGVIDNIFLHPERTVGTEKTFVQVLDPSADKLGGFAKTWDHFFVNLPPAVVVKKDDIGPKLSEARSTFDVFKRGLEELTLDAIDTVLELVAQDSLYRGEESKGVLEAFRKLKVAYDAMDHECTDEAAKCQHYFTWSAVASPAVKRVRNTAIGTLLIDLSGQPAKGGEAAKEPLDLEDAVKKFETSIMAPTNYKRPTALVSKAMIAKAQGKIEELGLTSALERRYAVLGDLTVNNILYVDRAQSSALAGRDPFAEIAAEVPENVKKLGKVEEVGIEDFVANILPKAASLEVLVENRHAGNLVSLVAPGDPGSKNLFKWPNKFSWSYAGEVTDSIKERVKKAGGKVDGDLRCSLSWFNYDDLDLHMLEPAPNGGSDGWRMGSDGFPHANRIYYGSKLSHVTHGELDVDMNAGGGSKGHGSRSAVENITYPDRRRMTEGVYQLLVQNYAKVETSDVGFEVELEFDGVTRTFAYAKGQRTGENVVVAEFRYTHAKGVEIVKSLPSTQASKTIWGLQTQTFQKVSAVMLSPNYWDVAPQDIEQGVRSGVGNKHWFFMLDGCKNEGKARGFYNEFLSSELEPHRKTMEMVGAKMRTEEASEQLSGLGFSSTQRSNVTCRVKGTFERIVKVVF